MKKTFLCAGWPGTGARVSVKREPSSVQDHSGGELEEVRLSVTTGVGGGRGESVGRKSEVILLLLVVDPVVGVAGEIVDVHILVRERERSRGAAEDALRGRGCVLKDDSRHREPAGADAGERAAGHAPGDGGRGPARNVASSSNCHAPSWSVAPSFTVLVGEALFSCRPVTSKNWPMYPALAVSAGAVAGAVPVTVLMLPLFV